MSARLPLENRSLPEPVYREILPIFIEEAEDAIAYIEAALKATDIAEIRQFAHKLKGGATSFGAHRLADLCQAFEHVHDFESKEVEVIYHQIKEEWIELLAFAESQFGVLKAVEPEKATEHDHFQKIVLIDDDRSVCLFNQELLKESFPASEVVSFTKAEEASEYLMALDLNEPENAAILVLVDLFMPSLDGYEFMELLEELESEQTAHLHVYMLTMDDSPRNYEKVKKYPLLKAIIVKPLSRIKLENQVQF